MQLTLTFKHLVYVGGALCAVAVGWIAGFSAGRGFWSQEAAGWAQAVGTFVAIWASTIVAIAVQRADRTTSRKGARDHAATRARALVASMAAALAAVNGPRPDKSAKRAMQLAGTHLNDERSQLIAANAASLESTEIHAALGEIIRVSWSMSQVVGLETELSAEQVKTFAARFYEMAVEQFNVLAQACDAEQIDGTVMLANFTKHYTAI